MPLAPKIGFAPMEARSVSEPPVGEGWQYEPKWDGFRCLAFKRGGDVFLQSKAGQPLGRYFPELVEYLKTLSARQFVLDGEIVVPVAGRLSFDELLMRIHPAESRVRKLAAEFPAMLIVFDLLGDAEGQSLVQLPLAERRARLESFAAEVFPPKGSIRLSPATRRIAVAREWFTASGRNLDGIIAKRLDMPYRSGLRDGMLKIKHRRTADCVVGGFRYAENKRGVGSLLLGLYDGQGLLNHVGFTSSFKAVEREKIATKVERLRGGPGFTGKAPGGPSRWKKRESDEWVALKPKLVIEVEYDHFTGDRFRHGTRFLRWRPDKPPQQCTLDQIDTGQGSVLTLLREGKTKRDVRRAAARPKRKKLVS